MNNINKVIVLNSKGNERKLRLSDGEYLALWCHKLDLEEIRIAIREMNINLAKAIEAQKNICSTGRKPTAQTIVLREYEHLSGLHIETPNIRWEGKTDGLGTIMLRYAMIACVGNTFGKQLVKEIHFQEPVSYKHYLTHILIARHDAPYQLINALLNSYHASAGQVVGFTYLAKMLGKMPSTNFSDEKSINSHRTSLYNIATRRRGISVSPYKFIIGLAELAQDIGLEIQDIFP